MTFFANLRRLASAVPLAALLASVPVSGAEVMHDATGPTLGGFVGTRLSITFGGRVTPPARFGIVGTTTFQGSHASLGRTDRMTNPAFEFDLLRPGTSAFRLGGLSVGEAKAQLRDGKTALIGGGVLGLGALVLVLSSGGKRERCNSASTPQDSPCFE